MASLSSKLKTDWEKCCLCQTEKKEDLKSPLPGSTEQDGYSMLATNIPLFQTIHQLPLFFDPSRLDEGNGIEATLRRNKAKYHQSCRLLFNNTKLERARKRTASAESSTDESHSKIRRASLDSQQCFLCEKEAPKSELRQAMTMELDRRLNECARNLNDGKLLARLTGGDIVAQELKYHRSCLTALYNRERAFLSTIEKEGKGRSPENEIYPLVFSELLAYVVETKLSTDGPVVFKLADLVSLYKQRLEQFGIASSDSDVHSTRLKEKLLAEIPELEAHKSGRDVLLAFKSDIGLALSQASNYSEAIILGKAAKILRRHMTDHEFIFDGRFHESCVTDAVPPALLEFVCMIEHGADIKSQLRFGASKTDSAMAQLLQYNCYSRHREGASTYRHSVERETPFPVFLGMSVYAKTRKKVLVQLLHDHGLSVSYDRVLAISAQLGDAAVSRYQEEGVVCPSVLRRGLFTTAAMDNIDHNPTATTATTSFHGTSISLFQHPTAENEGEKREPLTIKDPSVKKVPDLPDSYTNIRPAVFNSKTPSRPKADRVATTDLPKLELTNEFKWLEKVSLTQNIESDVSINWSAHHSLMKRGLAFEVSIAALLPLLREPSHSVATIRHVMDKVKETVAYLNPDQVPVITADQSIYAVAKQIQWQWPEQYGNDKFVIMFGGLHIEMAALKSIGTLLQSSGWTGVLVEAEITTSGTAESFLSASSVTRTRQIHQITASCLYKLQKEAYKYYCDEAAENAEAILSFDAWCQKRLGESPQFHFWHLVLTMELTILSLVRAFREANFTLYCQALCALIPFFFANNNVNYASWLPVHLKDMLSLEYQHPNIYQEFQSGKFVVFKSSRPFSAMAIDQAHEQANAVIKGEGGAIGVTEDPSALRRWMVAGPEVSRLATEYEIVSKARDTNESTRHHEQTAQAQRIFFEKVEKLFNVMKEIGNPFQEETADLLTLDTKIIASPNAAEMVSSHYQTGEKRFRAFIKGLEKGDEGSFYEPIKKNKLDFFQQKPEPASGDVKRKILKDDCRLFSRLFISCQSRECDLLEFFRHENQSFPAALSDCGTLHSYQKSQLAALLEAKAAPPDIRPEASVIIVDGSALINSLPPRTSKTFEEYASKDVIPTVEAFSTTYRRTDIIFDVYRPTSLKAETRSKRGQGARRRVTCKGKLPSNWRSFLRDNDNKTELFNFLADKIVEMCQQNIVIVIREEGAVSNNQISLEGIAPCNHEEADSRIFVHARHALSEGYMSLMIKASDTDVLVIAISVFTVLKDLGLENLWVAFGQAANLRWIPIHDISHSLGPQKSKGLPFFHAFTGCDVVSAFRGKGKKAAWQTWDVYPEATEVFTNLSMYPPVWGTKEQKVLERFVIVMYDRSSSATDVDSVRLDLFARKQKSYDAIPPTSAALVQHTKRAAYQAGCIWGQATICQQEIANPSEWGWKQHDNLWQIVWTTLPPIAESCQQLTKCGCKTPCGGRCKCNRFNLPCTELCSCNCEG